MPNLPEDNIRSPEERPATPSLRGSVQIFRSHKEARAAEVAQQAQLSPYERMKQFMELQSRIWGTDTPDVREAGTVKIVRREA
jgi:hypothetical protein